MEQENGRGPQYYLSLLKRRILLLLTSMLLVGAAGTAVVLYLKPVYRAEATLLVEPQQMLTGIGEPSTPAIPDEPLRLAEQRALSREHLIQVAEKLDLFPATRTSMSPASLSDLMRERTRIQRVEVGPGARPPSSPTFYFTVTFDDQNPTKAVDVVNVLVASILEGDVQARVGRASTSVQLLTTQVQELKARIAAFEDQISEFTQKNIGVLPGRLEFYLTQLESKKSELSTNDATIRSLDDEKRLLDLDLRLKASSGGSSAGESQGAGARLEALREELTAKSSLYAEAHPEIRSLKHRIALLEDQIQAALSQINAGGPFDPSSLPPSLRLVAERIKTLETRRNFLSDRRNEIMSSISALEHDIIQAPEVESVLRTLQGQREATQRSLDELAARLSTAEFTERLERDERAQRLRITEAPVVPEAPAKPNRLKLLVVVFGAAGFAGLASVLLVDFLDKSIREASDIRMVVSRVPVISISYVPTRTEQRRKNLNRSIGITSACAFVLAGLIATHVFILPLEQVPKNIGVFG